MGPTDSIFYCKKDEVICENLRLTFMLCCVHIFKRKNSLLYSCIVFMKKEGEQMKWPFNYPGNEYLTNVYGQIIILAEEAKEAVVDAAESIKESVEELFDE